MKTCKFCLQNFEPEVTKKPCPRSVFCSPSCRERAREKAIARKGAALRERRRQNGICLNCTTAVKPPHVTCERHRRRNTEKEHQNGKRKIRYLNTKLSPERKEYVLNFVKLTNPGLRWNWEYVKPWIEANFELWIDPLDGVFYNYVPLDTLTEPASPYVQSCCVREFYARLDGISLEDFVINKVDREREIQNGKSPSI
jgi:uncharacterized OB-fold protein